LREERVQQLVDDEAFEVAAEMAKQEQRVLLERSGLEYSMGIGKIGESLDQAAVRDYLGRD
jgi:hypothetical protein